MAKIKTKAAGKVYHCRECKHSYDYHELNYKGEPFLCKCPFEKYSKFLDSDYCKRFEKRQGV